MARTPQRRSAPSRSRLGGLVRWVMRAIVAFVLLSLLMVGVYRFVPPPFTLTMAGDLLGGHSIHKNWMSLGTIDPDMPRAAIAAEDGNFCRHHGFDFTAIEKAMAGNEAGRRYRGGSTVSQQTAKNVFLWQGRSYVRKALEAWFTVLIEALWGKQRIMEVYLNVAETGIGTYGANAGAMRYFGHDASRLSPGEASRIAAILPLPKKRDAIDPHGFVRRYGDNIAARIPKMQRAGFYSCLR
ncbi:monofunctional biosynthetic peptidoglycan transglycosylase [Sphingomonas nostoxanthinifaciens]|uniref:monofunctional biosynthetic peptidoglycan transglycosylase n=1 Tax=Sphingomonas nostoxanthinifaciens TaxID=2872652 RepID=UPI001CC20625|nr:monofunctional biosynthetic peptidoglycan transglycosylase [Sphingomonas nostoxanthinifaciens]UAK26090.1 monofunctional biosynthetic peptidoglycan transglycosylase [Sphingomonas nostoxanthinifaciens]